MSIEQPGLSPGGALESSPFKENRRWTRIPAQGQPRVVVETPQKVSFRGVIEDISFAGLALRATDVPDLLTGSPLKIHFRQATLSAIVRYCCKRADDSYRVGVAFVDPRPQELQTIIRDFLRE